MTLPATAPRASYAGAGTVGPFPYPFRIFAATDLRVTKRSSVGTESALSYPLDFAVTGVGDAAGGNVTPTTAIAVGEILVVRRAPQLGQPISIRNQGPYFPSTVEDEFDRMAMQILSLQDQVDRSVKLSESLDPAGYNVNVLDPAAGKVLAGTGAGFSMVALDSSAVALPGDARTVLNLSAYLANNAVWNIKDYGALCNDLADDTGAINSTITRANASPSAGGLVVAPPGSITRASGVQLKAGVTFAGSLSGRPGATLRLASAGTLVDTPATLQPQVGLVGFNLIGLGAATVGSGVRFRNGAWSVIERCFFQNFADQAIILDATATAVWVRECLAYNCLLNRARVAQIGVIDVDGADHIIADCEFTASTSIEGAIISANLYIAAVNVKSANHFFSNVVAEISDVGFYVGGSGLNRFANCRADLNYGPGWRIASGGNSFASCFGIRNSQTADNTYSGFVLDAGTAQGNTFSACYAGGLGADARWQKYGFEDNANYAAAAARNTFVACTGSSNRTRLFFQTASATASGIDQPPHLVVIADGTAVPDVSGTNTIGLYNYVTPTVITNFSGGTNGQTLFIFGSSRATIQHNGATIVTSTGANKVLRDGVVYVFKNFNGIWRELAHDQNLINQAVVYSAAMTLDASLSQMHTITATNGVAFTINAPTNPISGAVLKVRIRNTSGGALGAATWNAVFKMGAAWVQPATGFSRAIQFTFDGANWVEDWRSAADVAN